MSVEQIFTQDETTKMPAQKLTKTTFYLEEIRPLSKIQPSLFSATFQKCQLKLKAIL
jgi:hypothetical protein